MPTKWIEREISRLFTETPPALRLFPVWLLLGPRQVGKSSLLRRHAEPERRFVDLDDLATRQRANADPILFGRELEPPLAVDEIQYAPSLLSAVKSIADKGAAPGSIWITGSQSFEVMHGVRETLAGRVAILSLHGLTDAEKGVESAAPAPYFEALCGSAFPALHGASDEQSRSLYLSSYVATYVERDVRELLGIQKRREFELFLKVCALRTGQLVNYDELGRASGVSAVTAKEWLGLLEDSFVVRLARPYHENRSKRLVKSPKLYFLDAGLAAYLAGWRDPEMARLGPMGGALFETHVFANLLRSFSNRLVDGEIHFFRTKDGSEIDFLVEARGAVQPIEVKMGQPSARELPRLEKIRGANWKPGVVVSLAHRGPELPALTDEWRIGSPASVGGLVPG